MSEQGVDLSQIRGDWKFHIDYLINAVTQTLKRQMGNWVELSERVDNAAIDASVKRQVAIWDELLATANEKGTIPTADSNLIEFIDVCRKGKSLCDGFQDENKDDELVDEFAEACRQTRGLCDDLEMMRDQRPDDQ
jgi:hypothetical protein